MYDNDLVVDQGMAAAHAEPSARARFIQLTYMHLAAAVFALAGLLAVIVPTAGPAITSVLFGNGQMGWLLVLGAFMFVSWVAESWARNQASMPMQYAGLALYVVAQGLILTPLVTIAAYYQPDAILPAVITTLTVFGGLTAYVFISGQNFSWVGGFLSVAFLCAFGAIVASALFGFTMGPWFAALMVGLLAGAILYQTSNIIHEYPVGSHVAASLALFASVATMFWYILQLFMMSDD